jgi:hypothetical protein
VMALVIESDKYKAEVVDGLLKVWAKKEPVLVKTTYLDGRPDKQEVKPSPFS